MREWLEPHSCLLSLCTKPRSGSARDLVQIIILFMLSDNDATS